MFDRQIISFKYTSMNKLLLYGEVIFSNRNIYTLCCNTNKNGYTTTLKNENMRYILLKNGNAKFSNTPLRSTSFSLKVKKARLCLKGKNHMHFLTILKINKGSKVSTNLCVVRLINLNRIKQNVF